MRLFSERVEAPNDPLEIARRLSGRPGVVVARSGSALAYVASDPSARSHALDPEPELAQQPGALGETPRWFGFLPYDALRQDELGHESDLRAPAQIETPLWLRYPAVVRVDDAVHVIAENENALRELVARLQTPARAASVAIELVRTESGARHLERVERALEHIGRGTIYEVNLARRFELRAQGRAADLLAALEGEARSPHAFALELDALRVVAATPELCLRWEPDGTLVTSPIKGTRPRHADPNEDARLALELELDPKERAELTMIIDVERNDLGRIAEVGSVRLLAAPHVVSLGSVHHRVASVSGRVRSQLSRSAVLRAMLPSGSVTGAPKVRAMQLIRALEPERRGLYTGALGWLRQDGGLELAMAIRTLSVLGETAHYFAGGGIVADSVPERELEETEWKAANLLRLARSQPKT